MNSELNVLDALRSLHMQATNPLNRNQNAYRFGIAHGLEMALAAAENRDPILPRFPGVWSDTMSSEDDCRVAALELIENATNEILLERPDNFIEQVRMLRDAVLANRSQHRLRVENREIKNRFVPLTGDAFEFTDYGVLIDHLIMLPGCPDEEHLEGFRLNCHQILALRTDGSIAVLGTVEHTNGLPLTRADSEKS